MAPLQQHDLVVAEHLDPDLVVDMVEG